jgi:hypothetical protein
MNLDPGQYNQADCRAVDPPIPAEMTTWSKAGQLDLWVKEHRPRLEWFGGYVARTVGNGGSELVICVPPRAAHNHDAPGRRRG